MMSSSIKCKLRNKAILCEMSDGFQKHQDWEMPVRYCFGVKDVGHDSKTQWFILDWILNRKKVSYLKKLIR